MVTYGKKESGSSPSFLLTATTPTCTKLVASGIAKKNQAHQEVFGRLI